MSFLGISKGFCGFFKDMGIKIIHLEEEDVNFEGLVFVA